jgi:ABC-2 type transport system permease protein
LLEGVLFGNGYMELILGIFLKGAGFAELWRHAPVLLGIGVALLAVATGGFRRVLA